MASLEQLTPDLAANLSAAFQSSLDAPLGTDWNEREVIAKRRLSEELEGRLNADFSLQDVYLGGDLIRPYLAVRLFDEVQVVARERIGLSQPLMLTQVDDGIYGAFEKMPAEGMRHLLRRAACTPALAERLRVPNVFLVSLTNVSRYRSRRYPLNISRLAQWLRFQHSARVRVADLALNFSGNLDAMAADVVSSKPDILAISINFGEMEALRELIAIVRANGLRPFVSLGNVLAAWATRDVEDACKGFQYLVSHSYGEYDLEEVCLAVKQDDSRRFDTSALAGLGTGRNPAAIVMPDEALLAETLAQRGQASIETSFGCQYGHCTFCPREHRGKGWSRPAARDATAVLECMAALITKENGDLAPVLSIVDEDAFGQEGRDLKEGEPSVVALIRLAALRNVRCEIYTRLEQILDLRWEKRASLRRLHQLSVIQPSLARVFVGVESGSNSQLRRYGKGQSTADIVAALRAGALLRLPLEFGFITFDPLLTQEELLQSLEFLARRDVLLSPESEPTIDEIYSIAIEERLARTHPGVPLFSCVAYMATELELFVNSPYVKLLRAAAPHLIGSYDSAFARFNYSYQDVAIGQIADWCRVWTEGTFAAVYQMRLAARMAKEGDEQCNEIVGRYRAATFALLASLASRFCINVADRAEKLLVENGAELWLALKDGDGLKRMEALWRWVQGRSYDASVTENVRFTLETYSRRRAT
ncbi:MAG: hypothetical protein QOH39_1278 [Verrucomicrobiota bacterium]|jgi:hypothetical protein